MKPIIRNIILIVVLLILAAVGYKLFFGNKQATTAPLQTTAGVGAGSSSKTTMPTVSNAAPVGQDFLTLLLSVESIKLDDTIFNSQEFNILQDFNRPIQPDTNPGRPNPFAPIGADGPVVSSQVSTSNPSSVTSTASTLNGTLATGGASVTRWFQYGTTPSLGTMTTPKVQMNPGAFAEPVTGLLPNTIYYVKAGALINGATVFGNQITWKTAQGLKK